MGLMLMLSWIKPSVVSTKKNYLIVSEFMIIYAFNR